eukprot:1191356-Amorphochlora_amoeboformis.AAC.1
MSAACRPRALRGEAFLVAGILTLGITLMTPREVITNPDLGHVTRGRGIRPSQGQGVPVGLSRRGGVSFPVYPKLAGSMAGMRKIYRYAEDPGYE